jgi:hypothetical protein
MEQFFTRGGQPIPEREALDRNGIMRDGVIARTRMTMRDSIAPRYLRVTDAGGGSLHRPGFRLPAADSRITLDDGSDAMVRG